MELMSQQAAALRGAHIQLCKEALRCRIFANLGKLRSTKCKAKSGKSCLIANGAIWQAMQQGIDWPTSKEMAPGPYWEF